MFLTSLLPFFQTEPLQAVPLTIPLEGPFLPEEEALRHPFEYRSILEKTWFHSNLVISRDLLITCPDSSFDARDNLRLEAGITHHTHQLELYVANAEIDPLAIDHFILLNPKDTFRIRDYFQTHPLIASELKSLTKHGEAL